MLIECIAAAVLAVSPISEAGASGQPVPTTADDRNDRDAFESSEILIIGTRPRGGIAGDDVPDQQFDSDDVKETGAGTVSELVEAIRPRTRGGGSAEPAFLLNGRRPVNSAEVRDLPPEAIERVDVFPESVAVRHGFRADQQVYNFVLRENFRAVTADSGASLSGRGGRSGYHANINYLALSGPSRLSLDLQAQRDTSLLEAESDLDFDLATLPGSTLAVDARRFRTLLPAQNRVQLASTLSRALTPTITATLSARFVASESDSLFGIRVISTDGTVSALEQKVSTRGGQAGLALNGDHSGINWSLSGDWSRTRAVTTTDVPGALAGEWPDRAVLESEAWNLELLAHRRLFAVPAGWVNASARLGGSRRGIVAEVEQQAVRSKGELSRSSAFAQLSVDLPLASGEGYFLGDIGNLSASFTIRREDISGFRPLDLRSGALNWSPVPRLRINLSATREQRAPTLLQLGSPIIRTPAVRFFDFSERRSVEVTQVGGGNPALGTETRREWLGGASLQVRRQNPELYASLNYVRRNVANPVFDLPFGAEVEAAFPERFQRDAGGILRVVDLRPLNGVRHIQEELRWGWSSTLAFGGETPGLARRLQGSIYHRWRFEDALQLRTSLAPLDFLDGGAVSLRGGRPRHEVDLQLGYYSSGSGLILAGYWQAPTRVRSGMAAGDELRFSGLSTISVRGFVNLGRGGLTGPAWLGGTRLTVTVNNVLDSRISVRDRLGATPANYRSAFLDPVGRNFQVTLRRQF